MAKIYGLFGAMKGKTADVVMAVRYGEQIIRKYQPTVINPNTPAQVAARAKLKLMSQLSAVMAPVIAIPREGSVSSRNLFTKVNYGLASYSVDSASINLNNVQLTKSVVALPAIGAIRTETAINTYISNPQLVGGVNVDRIVYCLFEKEANDKLRFVTSRTVTEAGEGGAWAALDFPLINSEVVVLAYGMRDNTQQARAVFGDLTVISAEVVAKLIVTRTLTGNDVTLTETRGFTLAAAQV